MSSTEHAPVPVEQVRRAKAPDDRPRLGSALPGRIGSPQQLLHLQRVAGNQAVNQLLQRQRQAAANVAILEPPAASHLKEDAERPSDLQQPAATPVASGAQTVLPALRPSAPTAARGPGGGVPFVQRLKKDPPALGEMPADTEEALEPAAEARALDVAGAAAPTPPAAPASGTGGGLPGGSGEADAGTTPGGPGANGPATGVAVAAGLHGPDGTGQAGGGSGAAAKGDDAGHGADSGRERKDAKPHTPADGGAPPAVSAPASGSTATPGPATTAAPATGRAGPPPATGGAPHPGPSAPHGHRDGAHGHGAAGGSSGAGAAGPATAGGSNGHAAGHARLQHVLGQVHAAGGAARAHPGAGGMVGAAHGAAPSPSNEASSTAQAMQAGAMSGAKAGKFDKASFLAMIRQKLQEIAPKSNQDLKDFKSSGKADQMKGQLTQGVQTQSQAAQGQIAATAKAEPPTGSVQPRQPDPAPQPPPPANVPPIDGAQAAPPPAPNPAPAMQAQNQAADAKMAENKITPEQLRKANDPRFSAALGARDQMHANAQAAPGQFQAQQQGIIADAKTAAQSATGNAHAGMKDAHAKAHAAAHGHQQEVMSKDAAARKQVADNIQAMYADTKGKVEAKLKELDEPIDKLFEDGEKAARETFEQNIDHETTMEILTNPAMAAIGWLTGWDPVLRQIWEKEHARYMSTMEGVLNRVADKVVAGLNEAEQIISQGHAAIETYVAGLAPNLRQTGQEAERQVDSQFKELEHSVEAKEKDLANHLAERYQQAQKDIDDRMKELEESHRGLVGAFIDKINAVIEAIKVFKQKLSGIVQNAEETIDLIMQDPMAFLDHLLAAMKKGFGKFVDNIWTHLKKGLIGWLTGALSAGGITLPETWDLKGIAMLVLQILGFTWEHIEGVLTEIIGPQAMKVVKKVVGYVKTVLNGGIEGLWEQIKGELGGLKDMVFGAIQDWLVTTVVKVAIEKLVMLSNPAGAIVEAIEDIYKVVMFFVEKAQQIATLVETIVNSVHKIAQGDIEDAASWIERTMGDTIPVILGFLADLLGLGGISETIAGLIKKARDFIWNPIKKLLQMLWEKAKGLFKDLFGGDKKDEHGPDDRTDQQKQQDLDAGVAEADSLLKEEGATADSVKKRLPGIKTKYKMTALDLVVDSNEGEKEKVHVHGAVNPERDGAPEIVQAGGLEFVVLHLPNGDKKIGYDEPEVDIKGRMSSRRKLEVAMQGLEISQEVAQELLKSVGAVGDLLLSFAKSQGDPEKYLQSVLEVGHTGMAAVAGPVSANIRDKLVYIGEGRSTLSKYALVFNELHPGQFSASTSPTAGVTEYNFRVGGERRSTDVLPRGVVETDDDGNIVKICAYHPKVGVSGLVDLMRAAGWKIKLA